MYWPLYDTRIRYCLLYPHHQPFVKSCRRGKPPPTGRPGGACCPAFSAAGPTVQQNPRPAPGILVSNRCAGRRFLGAGRPGRHESRWDRPYGKSLVYSGGRHAGGLPVRRDRPPRGPVAAAGDRRPGGCAHARPSGAGFQRRYFYGFLRRGADPGPRDVTLRRWAAG